MKFLLRIRLFALCCLFFSCLGFSQATLKGAEYFWDTDPGVGNAYALTSQDGNYNEAIETAFSTALTVPATAGLHTFNVRFKDHAGVWGPVYKRTVVNQPTPRSIKITAGECFWDTDPGSGSGIALLAFDNAYDEAIETVFKNAIALPSTGVLHVFNVRLKDENGEWGPLFKRIIAFQDAPRDIKITAAEYFWGTTDPGVGAGVALLAFDGAYNEALETVLKSPASLPSLNGLQLFNMRVKDENGTWGPLFKRVIALQDVNRNLKITAAEYFWGATDPGQGAGTTLLAFDGAYDEALETAIKNAASVPSLTGLQLFNIRVKDENGVWGPLFKRTIALQDVPRTIKITTAEYFWGASDPGQGAGTALLAFDGAYDEALETVIKNAVTMPALQGLQLFNIRVKDENGVWGPLFKRTISVQDTPRNIKLSAAEYFWGMSDPGAGAGTAMLAFDGAFDKALETALSSSVSSPGIGLQLFNLRLKDENGAWGPVFKRTIYMQIPGNTLPINVTTSSGVSTICQGSAVTLTATGGTNYTWSPATGLSATTGASVIATPTSTTSYTVTSSDAQGNTGTSSITLTVNPSPTVTITTLHPTCPSGSTLTATGGGTYSWSTGATTASIQVSPSTITNYTVTVTSNGCSTQGTKTITPVDTLTWTGAVDSDWHKPCNWSPQFVPECCNSVLIPLKNNQPIVSGIAAAKDVSIYTSSGALVTVNTGANLQVGQCPITTTQSACPSLAVITTTAVSNTTSTTAVSGGTITYQGASAVTARGICWSTSVNPTLANSFTTTGTGVGTFVANLTGLTAGTTYYMRAYATNASGTSYGNEVSFVSQTLAAQYPAGSVFCAGPTAIVDVTNPTTGKTWMDRNLGASQVATSAIDAAAYGDLYQWGRGTDGHQCRTSATTTTLSSTDQPGHGNFIIVSTSPNDWRSPQNDNLWQGVNGVNNPCPTGYRIPTEVEFSDEVLTWYENNDVDGAYNSPLKLITCGFKAENNVIYNVDSFGAYWTSSTINNNSIYFRFATTAYSHFPNVPRNSGMSIRCIKN